MNLRNPFRCLALTLALATAVGCAPTVGEGTSGPRTSRDHITTEEIRAATQRDAYLLIQELRPQWFRMRSAADNPVVVYVDGVRHGGMESLRAVSTTNLERAQYLSGTTATTRFGLDHGSGAILVFTRRN